MMLKNSERRTLGATKSICEHPNSKVFGEDTIYSLRNVTLLEGIKSRGNDCPLNLEVSPLFDLEELTPEGIKNRSELLLNELKNKMKLFDAFWISRDLTKRYLQQLPSQQLLQEIQDFIAARPNHKSERK
ncbi:8278_t:CDS:2, partial [Ambispora gerdemannii]